jgi:hypothetical protein
MPLTDSECRNAKPGDKARKLNDGAGLYLFLSAAGGRAWRFDYTLEGKRKTATFGKYPKVTLAQAREKRETYKRALAEGRDPTVQEVDDRPKFETVARDWYATNLPKWKTSYSTRIWKRTCVSFSPSRGAHTPTSVNIALRQVGGAAHGAFYLQPSVRKRKRRNFGFICVFRESCILGTV